MSAVDRDGENVEIAASINEDKANEYMSLACCNILVTSETAADPADIVSVYHHL